MIPYISADRERAAAAMPEACGPGRRRRGRDMPARTERYRFVRWEIEDVNGVARTLPGGYADVTRGGGLRHERVVFLGPGGEPRTEVHLKRGTSASWSSSASPPRFPTPTTRQAPPPQAADGDRPGPRSRSAAGREQLAE